MLVERAGVLLVDQLEAGDDVAVAGVGDGLHGAGLLGRLPGEAGLLGGDGEAGHVDQVARRAGVGPEVVLHGAAADHGEVGRARLVDGRLVVGELGVVLVELELLAVDAAGGVAPLDERVAGVEDLLVEAGAAGEAGVGHGAQLDAVLGDALGVVAGGHLAAALVGPAHPLEVAPVAGRRVVGRRGGGRVGPPGATRRVGAAIAAAGDDDGKGNHGEDADELLHVFPICLSCARSDESPNVAHPLTTIAATLPLRRGEPTPNRNPLAGRF